ncbi:MAG: glycoside hydrolase family 3 protein [Clostridia bacterium]|nr:glycoside hydrolase family 3 protein [Clostridia bacterium]
MKKTLSALLTVSIMLSMASCKTGSNQTTNTTNIINESESTVNTDISETSETTEATKVTANSTEETQIVDEQYLYMKYAQMSPEEITASLTLEQKAAQMVQPAIYNVSVNDMLECDYGSILSQADHLDAFAWRNLVDEYQKAAITSEAGIPFLYGQDDVHGVNYCSNAVYFPHNIGQGAANDEELAYQVGLITADEAKLCHMLWNFSPCLAQSADPRWGRTYESYGSDIDIITKLGTAYTRGLIDGGLIACAKHFFADGNVKYGTGEKKSISMLIDRGDAQLTEEEIQELLGVYQAEIDSGVQTIMISHSSLNGVKMHENKEYIMKLKDEMGFEGFIVSDWDSVQNTSGSTYREQIITSVNAGIDMFMEVERFDEAKEIIIEAVENGEISEERINDAVTRIIKVKKDAGIFDDPLCEKLTTVQEKTGSDEYRKVAEKLVEESLVLIKNDNDTLPLKEGTKVYITGPAADNCQVQCGGWTIDWNSSPDKNITGVTTILEAFKEYADNYGIEVITNPDEAQNADVVLLCVGEQSYAEWNGDTEDMELCGALGLPENKSAIEEAKALGKPTVTCIVAGRQVILNNEDYNDWDSVVMCYLPGSEGKGISDVLCGCADFTGKLPSPWYGSVDQIGTDNCFLELGYGLTYGDDFTAREEP